MKGAPLPMHTTETHLAGAPAAPFATSAEPAAAPLCHVAQGLGLAKPACSKVDAAGQTDGASSSESESDDYDAGESSSSSADEGTEEGGTGGASGGSAAEESGDEDESGSTDEESEESEEGNGGDIGEEEEEEEEEEENAESDEEPEGSAGRSDALGSAAQTPTMDPDLGPDVVIVSRAELTAIRSTLEAAMGEPAMAAATSSGEVPAPGHVACADAASPPCLKTPEEVQPSTAASAVPPAPPPPRADSALEAHPALAVPLLTAANTLPIPLSTSPLHPGSPAGSGPPKAEDTASAANALEEGTLSAADLGEDQPVHATPASPPTTAGGHHAAALPVDAVSLREVPWIAPNRSPRLAPPAAPPATSLAAPVLTTNVAASPAPVQLRSPPLTPEHSSQHRPISPGSPGNPLRVAGHPLFAPRHRLPHPPMGLLPGTRLSVGAGLGALSSPPMRRSGSHGRSNEQRVHYEPPPRDGTAKSCVEASHEIMGALHNRSNEELLLAENGSPAVERLSPRGNSAAGLPPTASPSAAAAVAAAAGVPLDLPVQQPSATAPRNEKDNKLHSPTSIRVLPPVLQNRSNVAGSPTVLHASAVSVPAIGSQPQATTSPPCDTKVL